MGGVAQLLFTDEELAVLGACVQDRINEISSRPQAEPQEYQMLNSLRTALSEARYTVIPAD